MKEEKGFLVRYFSSFGLKQICDILLFAAAIVTLVGLCVYESSTQVVLFVGIGLFILASLLADIRYALVLVGKTSKRSPEYKNARNNVILMSIVLALSILALVFAIMYY